MSEVALKEYFDRRLDDTISRMIERFRLNEEAVAKAERTMNDRLNSMNEFRDALRDQSSRMITRPEHDKLDADIRELQREKANLDGRLAVYSGAVATIVSIIISVVALIISHFFSKG